MEISPASLAEREKLVDLRRKKSEDYVADLRHKGLHNLSGEIDRCLKKVSEGVETFEDIWQKVHNATNTNQKEKYEAELKKEIKKLQRLRDQTKPWIASGEIKDKSNLVETRKLIETLMERFKVIERENKTKAYSKEGLLAAQKLDPTTKEREELNTWLMSSIDALQLQMDQFESEVEFILTAKKKRLDKVKRDRLEELQGVLERHKFHSGKLETLMRMLHNLLMDVNAGCLRNFLSQVGRMKEDIDYYLESNQEPEFEGNEFLYDDIEGLEEFEDGLVGQPVGGTAGEEGSGSPTSITPTPPLHSGDASDPEKSYALDNVKSSALGDSVVTVEHNNSPACGVWSRGVLSKSPSTNSTSITGWTDGTATVNGVLLENGSSREDHSSPHTQLMSSSRPSSVVGGWTGKSGLENGLISPLPLTHESTTGSSNNQHFSSSSGSVSERSQLQQQQQQLFADSSSSSALKSSYSQQTVDGFAAAVAAGGGGSYLGVTNNSSDSTTGFASNVSNVFGVSSGSLIGISNCSGSSGANNFSSVVLGGSSSNVIGLTSSIVGGDQNSGVATEVSHRLSKQQIQQLQQYQQHQGPTTSQSGNSRDSTRIWDDGRLPQDQMLLSRILNENDSMAMGQDVLGRSSLGEHNSQEKKIREGHIPPLLGVAPLGPVPVQKDQLQMVESAHRHLPISADSERMRHFLPRDPYPTPQYYPQAPLTNSDSLEFFQRLSIETLVFIFYYLEGTRAQYMAAKALKMQNWRFHTGYGMWFQRHEEPDAIHEEFERGNYVYFDFEKWSQRKKDGFVFDYRYLEDEDLK